MRRLPCSLSYLYVGKGSISIYQVNRLIFNVQNVMLVLVLDSEDIQILSI